MMHRRHHILTAIALLALLLAACSPPQPSRKLPPTLAPRAPEPVPMPATPTVIQSAPTAAHPPNTPSEHPPSGTVSLPQPPACSDLACYWTTLDIARLQGHAPEQNVLKLFTAAVDSTHQRVYVAGILTRPIAVLDSKSGQWVGTVDSGVDGSAYRYVYIDPAANYLYIVDESHAQLLRLDLQTGELAGPVSLPEHVGAVVVDSLRTRLYLTTPDAPTFRALDGRTLQTAYTLNDLGPGAGPMAMTATGDALYVLNVAPQRGGEIFHLDPQTGRLVRTISYPAPLNQRPRHLWWDDAHAWFIVATERIIQVLDQAGKEQSAFTLPRAGELQDLAYNAVQAQLLVLWLAPPEGGQVAARGGLLQVLDVPSGRVLHELSFGNKPHRLVLDAPNGKLYIPNGDASILWSIDTSTYARAEAIRLGDSVEQIALANGGRQIVITSRLGGSYIFACDLDRGAWETFVSGTWPIPLRTDASGEKLFVLNVWDSTLAIYNAKGERTLIATIPLGIPRGSTDRLPDLAIDSSHRRAYVAYPEFGRIVVVDWEAQRVVKTVEVSGFQTGDTGGGPAQLQVAVHESANLLYAFWKDEHRLSIYDGNADYRLVATVDLQGLDWRAMRNAPATDNLFVDAAQDRLFIGPFEAGAKSGQPTGRCLARGQQVLALDEAANAYWAVGVETVGGKATNVLVMLDRNTLQERASQALNAASGTGESFALDSTQRRLYVGKMTTAEVELWTLGAPVPSATPASAPTPVSAAPTAPSAQRAGAPNTYWVTNPTSKARLYVQVLLPRNASGKLPALVLVPGGIGDSSNFLQSPKARTLTDAGFAVILFDPDGRGRSEGEENLNGHTHQDGLAAVIRFAATLPEVDASKIGLVTYSYGITMGSGALARYPDLPVRFLIDWEGPADRRYTTGDCHGKAGGIPWPDCSDDAFWREREAVNSIGRIRVPYQRIQSQQDHAQPVVTHAVEMVNAAVQGGVPWVRLNDNPPNQTYDPHAPPKMLPEATDRRLEELIARYAQELLGR